MEQLKKVFEAALARELDHARQVGSMEAERPREHKMGDLAFPCFRAAKALGENPSRLAERLAKTISVPGGELVAVGPYLNLKLSPAGRARLVLAAFLGTATPGAGSQEPQTVLVEYSSPNIAKLFTIGHLRSTMIGHALAQVNKYLGLRVYRLNHLGDWGTQFGALLAAYKRWAEADNPKLVRGFPWTEDPSPARCSPLFRLFQLYVRFHDEEESDPSLRPEARDWFKRLELGDHEARRLWAWFRELSLVEFQRVYNRLGVAFDSMAGESFYEDKLGPTVERLRESGLLEDGDDGAKIVRLDDVGVQTPCIALKGDGASIYATRDLAAALHRKERYSFDRCIYVVGSDQILHFRQIFAVLGKLDPWFEGRMLHTPFGMVKLPQGKMSTREGNVVFLEDVLDEAAHRALTIIEEKNPDLAEKHAISEMLGMGAVVFFDAMNDRVKPITFTWERAIALEGDTGPYVQYAHARICSVLRKAGGGWACLVRPSVDPGPDVAALTFRDVETPACLDGLSDDSAQALLFGLAGLHDAIVTVQRENMATALARQLVAIARAFSVFYTNCPILREDVPHPVREARLAICVATARALRQGLWLMGICAPEEM